jgi:hypothetical protein
VNLMDESEPMTVLDACRRLGLDYEAGGQVLKAVAEGAIPSIGEPRREPWHLVKLSDVEAWLSARRQAAS